MKHGQTVGEHRVRVKFNPDDNSSVQTIKEHVANTINLISEELTKKALGADAEDIAEIGRLKSLAMTSLEEAAMWAVKGATY